MASYREQDSVDNASGFNLEEITLDSKTRFKIDSDLAKILEID